jgi:hypothetical protein
MHKQSLLYKHNACTTLSPFLKGTSEAEGLIILGSTPKGGGVNNKKESVRPVPTKKYIYPHKRRYISKIILLLPLLNII